MTTTNDDLLDNLDDYDYDPDDDAQSNLGLGDDDGIVYVEIELPDGSTARWAKEMDSDAIDALTNAVEALIGAPHTLIA